MPSSAYLPLLGIFGEKDDVLAGWVLGAISAAISVRWITFPDEKLFAPNAKNTFASVAYRTYRSVEQGTVAAS